MSRNKTLSTLITSLLLLSTLAIIQIPTTSSGSFTEENENFYGTMTPQTVTAGYDGKEVKFEFSITSNTTEGTDIDYVNVTLPTGWEFVSAECNNTWTATNSSTTVAFTSSGGSYDLVNGTTLLFNITANVLVGTGEWTIDCYDGGSTGTLLGTVTETVLVTPYFNAEISPDIVKSGSAYVFELTITHNTTLSSIYEVAVQYPSSGGWSFSDIVAYPQYWVFSHNTSANTITFTATGGNLISSGTSAVFSIEMILGEGASDGAWSVTALNTAMQQAAMSLTVTVDDDAPTISITAPADDARVCGSVWINATITEPNLQSWAIKINGTQVTTGTSNTISYSWNTSAYADGVYVINVTATDVVENIGSSSVSVTVDNTAPQLIEIKVRAYDESDTLIGEYEPIGDTIWIPNATSIRVNATFYDTASLSGYMYFNTTAVSFSNSTWLPTLSPQDVSTVTSMPVKINITDDLGNRYVHTWYVSKDFNPPSAITYTKYQLICSGIIIWGISATDEESVIVGYNVYINGSAEYITVDELASETWQQFDTHLYAFSGTLVVALSEYAGEYANITIAAVDGAENEMATAVYVGTIPDGTWHPVELYEGWNLFSLPLIPNSTSTSDIYSLILEQGADGVTVTYGFDNAAKTWVMNPTTMTDGEGYWIYMEAYDVIIVQGRSTPEPPALPTTYHLPAGWCLVGVTETSPVNAYDYVESLESGSYFRWLYVWDAETQSWSMVDTLEGSTGTLSPGQAFWIYLYVDQDLIPPIPD